MTPQYLASGDYDTVIGRITAVLNTHKRTVDCPDRLPKPHILRYNLSAALWAARIQGGKLLDPVFTASRKGQSLLNALETMEPDEGTGRYEADQIKIALADAGVFPARVRVIAA